MTEDGDHETHFLFGAYKLVRRIELTYPIMTWTSQFLIGPGLV